MASAALLLSQLIFRKRGFFWLVTHLCSDRTLLKTVLIIDGKMLLFGRLAEVSSIASQSGSVSPSAELLDKITHNYPFEINVLYERFSAMAKEYKLKEARLFR